MDFLQQPIQRDTTPNSTSEILRRLAFIAHVAGFLLGPLLLIFGAARGNGAPVAWGAALLALALGLHFTRGRWSASAPAAPKTGARPPLAASAGVAARPSAAPVEDTGAARPRLVLLNAALAGPEGNTARLLTRIAERLAPHADLARPVLAGPGARSFAELAPTLRAADGFLIATGTHWDGWSSPLQKFLEDATPAEASALWLGKPAAVLVSEHSTGGKGVLSRLQGVLVTLGCWLPPLSGVVLAKSTQAAARATREGMEDFWCADDLDVLADNLLAAARQPRAEWRTWPVDRADFAKVWVE